MAQRIELWPLSRLKPYERNARTHSAEQVAQIAASIVEFGFTNPILVDSSDGIIAGHGRLQAALELGLSTVPVVVLDHLSDRQRRAYILADNQLALNAGWDLELLRTELQDLVADDFDLSVIGFSDEELSDLLPEVEGLAGENLQARLRGVILMSLSNQHGWLVLTTGNKSEVAVGYCTIYGDMNGGYNPIKDLY